MPEKETPYQLTGGRSNCELDGTLKGGNCEEQAGVKVDGLLLCGRHARMLEAQDRVDLLSGIIACSNLCLGNVVLRRDANLMLLLRATRAGAEEELNVVRRRMQRLAT